MGVWDLQNLKKKINSTALLPCFHSWCLVTMTFGVICTYIYLINIWQVVSFQSFLLHCMERSPASPMPLATQGQTSPKSWWPSRLAYFRCSSHGGDKAFISLSFTCKQETAFIRRLKEGIISGVVLLCLKCPAFLFCLSALQTCLRNCTNVITKLLKLLGWKFWPLWSLLEVCQACAGFHPAAQWTVPT